MAGTLPQAPATYDRQNEAQLRRSLETRLNDLEASVASLLTTYGTLSLGETTITLASTSGAQNDVAIGYATYVRFSNATGSFSITGLAGGERGRLVVLRNASAQQMTLSNESASSVAANRIVTQTGSDVTLSGSGGNSAVLIYDATSERWVVLATYD